jgi:hypothetical protein
MRVALAVSSVLVAGLALGAQQARSDMAPPVPTGNWGQVDGTRFSWADGRHGWRLAGPRQPQGWWRRILATEDGGKHWTTVLRMRRRIDGVAYMNRLSARVGVALVYVQYDARTLLTVDNGRTWHEVRGGRQWRLFEGDARTLYLSPYDVRAPSNRLYRLERWPSTRPKYVLVYDATGMIVSLRNAPGGVVMLLEHGRYEYSVAIHRHGRTRVYAIPGTGLDATPHTCEAFRFTVEWPVLTVVAENGQACQFEAREFISRDGGRTWESRTL